MGIELITCWTSGSGFGSSFTCDMGTFPDPPIMLIDASYILAGLLLALGLLTVISGRILLPLRPRVTRSSLASRLLGVSEVVAAGGLVASTTALAQMRGTHLPDPRYQFVVPLAILAILVVQAMAWWIDRRQRQPPPRA